jgi:hypothetical protein
VARVRLNVLPQQRLFSEDRKMQQHRPLELSDAVRRLLIKLRKLSNVTAQPILSTDQIRSVEETLAFV